MKSIRKENVVVKYDHDAKTFTRTVYKRINEAKRANGLNAATTRATGGKFPWPEGYEEVFA